jgi:hypothetical protein
MVRISNEISLQSAASGSTTVTIATWLLVVSWLVGTADAFRLGRRRDEADRKASPG